ncbi:protein Wnt-7b-like [Thrips palmi]|uniref:Protein Wnt n=1 Tax=Thrips palmi TaxID=161013 RepID=A0A6P8ZKP8_THRPL|nr:protein Wnt-7b-like [Thrips palmi]
MAAVGSGLRLALQECQHQFRHERWNCSAPPHASHASSMPLVIRVPVVPGASHGVPNNLGPLGPLGASSEPQAAFRWGGCSSDVEYGAKLSRTFTDAAQPTPPPLQPNSLLAPRLLMDSHNSKAGRKAVKLTLQTDCKCHGVSGSCSIRTCWTSLAQFRVVGDHLMARYRAAWPAVALPVPAARARRHPVGLRLAVRHAQGHAQGRNSRTAVHQQHLHGHAAAPRLPRRTDLVFLQVSPNYCDRDIALGSLGTAGRACNRTSRGADGCAVMCCGRGYNTRQVTSSRQCHCKFHWCCYVHCEVCTDRYEEYTCK